MNERIIDIILYLVTQIRQETPIELIDVNRLSDAGYTASEIGAACSWLVDRATFGTAVAPTAEPTDGPRRTFRVLHESERRMFRPEAYGYLLQLFEIGLIDVGELETVINRAQIANLYALDTYEVKTLIGMLLAESGDLSFGGSRLMLNSHDVVH
jgi:uncharacterized protein Smg (DUF494 family)